MWPSNSPFPKKIEKSSTILKSSFSEKIKDNISNNLISEISFKTPIKEISNFEEINNNSPFKLNFNYYLRNFSSPGVIKSITPINNNTSNYFMTSPNKNKLFSEINKDYFYISKTNDCPSFIIPQNSLKENINNNSSYTYNTYNIFSSSNSQQKFSNNNIGENDLTKKNLSLLFNKANNDEFEYKIIENKVIIGDKDKITDNKNNLFDFNFNSPIKNNNKSKKIFECSGSTFETFSSISIGKKRRLRKSERQLFVLKKFYSENKLWSKYQIKELSSKIGIKENKVYKWLWDQRNKDAKNNIFIINKKKEKNENSNII